MLLSEFLDTIPEQPGTRRPSRAAVRDQFARQATRPGDGLPATKRRKPAPRPTFDPFPALCVQEGLPRPVPELRFHPTRKWRFDWAWPEAKVALEVDGGVWTGGRHTRGAGWTKDTAKLNAAHEAGWRLLRCTPDTLCTAATLASLRATLSHDTP